MSITNSTPRERFDALSEKDQAKILDKHRHWNTEHDWWDSTYDCFKEDMEKIGIEVDHMFFSGFSSQGDGACFEGRVSDWPKFLASLGYTCPALMALAETGWRFSVVKNGHYSHENCTSFSTTLNTLDCNDAFDDEDFAQVFSPYRTEIQTAAWMALIADYKRDDLEEKFTEAFKDHMRQLYKMLEEEYEYLTTDESVLDSLDANDMLEEEINLITEEYEDA
jgi:hypothetical protein